MIFDRYVMVDWSAKSTPSPNKPSPDAIWIGDLAGGQFDSTYCKTRAEALARCRAILGSAVDENERVLIGFDFPFGFPAGFAGAARLGGADPWRALWHDLQNRIQDGPGNANNRFAVARDYNELVSDALGPFWGCPAPHAIPPLSARSKGLIPFPYPTRGGTLAKFRLTEQAIPGKVQEVWKLMGVGSVGSQALLGIPAVAQLRFDDQFARLSQVWPFETGLRLPDLPPGHASIVFAEIWPGIVDGEAVASLMNSPHDLIKDEAQVRLMCEWAHLRDANGQLAANFSPSGAAPALDYVVSEEGWILGCP